MALIHIVVCRTARAPRPFRAWALICLFMVALVIPGVPTASADEPVQGHLQIGRFETGRTVCIEPPSQGCVPPPIHGLDRLVFTVDAVHLDRLFWVNGTGLLYDLDIYFFDGDDRLISKRNSSLADELGIVPSDAATAVVVLFQGYDTSFTFESGPLKEG